MTKDEIKQFVMAMINDYDTHEATRRIVDAWVEDVKDAIAEAGEISDADACDGPCCTGSAYEPLSIATPDPFVESTYGIERSDCD